MNLEQLELQKAVGKTAEKTIMNIPATFFNLICIGGEITIGDPDGIQMYIFFPPDLFHA